MCVCVCLAGTGEVDKEGLDDQISRLAKLIGRLEDKVGVFLVIWESISLHSNEGGPCLKGQ